MMYGPFTSWESLLKGQESDESVIAVAEIIGSIPASFIKFTALNPDGSLEECFLGSADGNTKFLLGLCSPGFHVAPYHYQIIYPSLSPEQAQYIYDAKEHPSLPDLWVETGNIPTAEGDIKSGKPHPFFGAFGVKKPESPTILIGKDTHVLDVQSRELSNIGLEVTYNWDVIQACPQFYLYPELANQVLPEPEDLNPPEEEQSVEKESLKEEAGVYKGMSFKDNCFPLVKSLYPKPGTLVKVEDNLYGLITPDKVKFVDKLGKSATFSCFDLDHLNLIDSDVVVTQEPLLEFSKIILGKKLENINE